MSEVQKDKGWVMTASDGVKLQLTPVFVIQGLKEGEIKLAGDKEVECTMFHCVIRDRDGRETEMDIAFQEIFMFIYYCCNEERRQELQLRIQKQITEIPYEVTFKLDRGEIAAGMAKRLIKLPVDEIAMALARSESQLMAGKANLSKLNDWFAKRQLKRKGRNGLSELLDRK